MAEVLDEKLRRQQQEDKLAADIIDECRVQLMLKFRFLDRALWRMGLVPVHTKGAYPLATNGHKVAYEAPRVVARFKQSFDESIRDYLHMVLHCIFRHPYNRDHKDRDAWNLTCDVIAESVAMDLCAGRFPSDEDAVRAEALSTIRMTAGDILPGKVYELFHNMNRTPDGQHYRGLGKHLLNEWHALFERDDHSIWPAYSEKTEHSENDADVNVPPDNAEGENENQSVSAQSFGQDEDVQIDELPESMREQMEEQSSTDEGESSQVGNDESDEGADVDSPEHETQGSDPMGNFHDAEDSEHDEKEWEEVSKQIEMNLDTFSKEWGDEAAGFMQNLSVANRKRYDYTDFLKQFATQSEEMLINPDEFDYVYYTYGLDLYGNMPLVEPLEYKETQRVHDFVIAIDTSESVSGDLVREFVRHTFSLLKSAQDFASDVNVHVVQADSRVQEDMVIKDLRDVDKMMENFAVRGFGGTDFRPVFDYVQGMREAGKLPDMRGMIYFTDGLGTFPSKAPDFDAAFIFMEDETKPVPAVPPWAIKIVIDESSIMDENAEDADADTGTSAGWPADVNTFTEESSLENEREAI